MEKKTSQLEITDYKDTGLCDVAYELGLGEESSNIFQYSEYMNATLIVDEDLNIIGGKIHRFKEK